MKKFYALFAALFAATSILANPGGDIFEIRPCKEDGTSITPKTEKDPPYGPDEYLYFNIRLVSREENYGVLAPKAKSKFTMTHNPSSLMPESYDALYNPLKVAISVSGKTKWAQFVKIQETRQYQSTAVTYDLYDMVFRYKTEPGDFALPIKLAADLNGTPVGEGSSRSTAKPLFLNKDTVWKVNYVTQEGAETDAALSFSAYPPTGVTHFMDNYPETDLPWSDNFTMKDCGFYVQTVDFAGVWASADYWKEVAANGGKTKGQLEVNGGVTNAVTFYVWSTNENVVQIYQVDSKVKVTKEKFVVDYVGGKPQEGEYYVAAITISGGQSTSASFGIKGVTKDLTTHLVLSGFKGYRFNEATNEKIIDFKTVPVHCKEPEPCALNLTRVGDRSCTIGSDYENPLSTSLQLELTEAYSNEIFVTIAPVLENPKAPYLTNQIVRINNEGVYEGWRNADPLVVRLEKEKAQTKNIDVYGMGADRNYTTGPDGGVAFKIVKIEPADAKNFIKTVDDTSAVLDFKPATPVVTKPAVDESISFEGGTPKELDFDVVDTFANMQDTNEGYKVYWKMDEYASSYEVLKDKDGNAQLWRPNSAGRLYAYANGAVVNLRPSVTYTEKLSASPAYYYLEAFNGEKSAVTRVLVTCTAPAGVEPVLPGNSPYIFDEGTNVSVSIRFSDGTRTKQDYYAYFSFNNTNQYEKMGNTKYLAKQGTKGLRIPKGTTGTFGTAVNFNFDDGTVEGEDFEFCVLLSTNATFEANGIDTSFATNTVTATVMNVEPEVYNVRMNKAYKAVLRGGEYWMSQPVAQGVPVTFDVIGTTKNPLFSDPSSNDKYQTDTNKLFRTAFWTEETGVETVLYGDPAKTNFTCTFNNVTLPGAGTLVRVQMMDKDMNDTSTGGEGLYGEPFEFYVEVSDQPTIGIAGIDDKLTFYEDKDDPKEVDPDNRSFLVQFSQAPTVKQKLKLTVTSNDPSSNNPGTMELKPVANTLETTTTNGVYILWVPAGRSQSAVTISKLDGTPVSSEGFNVDIEVLTDPTGTTDWKKYYLTQAGTVKVVNSAPRLKVPSLDMQSEYLRGSCGYQNTQSNAYAVGATVLSTPLKFNVSDIDLDLNKIVSAAATVKTNLTVVWSVGGVEQMTTNVTDKTQWIEFTPNFSGMSGLKTVTVTVTDKDDGTTRASWYYRVEVSKSLTTRAHGPAAAASVGQSSRYIGAGIGEGHTWVEGVAFSKASDFSIAWNCGLSKTVTCYAWGYKVNDPVDDGTLNGGMDVSIDENGNNDTSDAKTKFTKQYVYTNSVPYLDSYFYRWISIRAPTNNKDDNTEVFAAATPELGSSKPSPAVLGLPTEEDKEGGYGELVVEAVFSKEYLASDNMGDVNHDFIPDAYVSQYRFDVVDATGNVVGDDMLDLSDNNADEDYLPYIDTASFAHFAPGLSNTWVTAGRAFTAKLEIRGWGDCLNDALTKPYAKVSGYEPTVCYTSPLLDPTNSTLTVLEWEAFSNQCVKAGWDPTDKTKWSEWSPERPTDPTKADTDGDGMTDGYEYYVWYRAVVGYMDGNEHKYLTGYKFRPDHPLDPEIIPPSVIAANYDPLVKSGSDFAKVDTDNDGLPDAIEFMLGTSPFDYDSDGDGLPDGYEVFISQTDPLKYATDGTTADGDLNPDGDQMAFYQYEDYNVVPVEGGYICTDGNTPLTLEETAPGVTNIAALTDGQVAYTAWRYGSGEFCRGHVLEAAGAYTGLRVTGEVTQEKVDIMHFQVYQEFGFDPRVGWNPSPHWVGHRILTKPFTHRDEFLTQAFYYHMCGLTLGDITASEVQPFSKLWVEQTTNPLDADTDHDNMPDGWELYTQASAPEGSNGLFETLAGGEVIVQNGPGWMYSPIEDFAKIAGTAAADPDPPPSGDGLDFVHEFCGVESCAVYANCETIKNVQPLWKNKWWPTDPWNPDTDGDGLYDGAEGAAFIYGSFDHTSSDYEDCVPGGGLNPNSWDTDKDGLPDPWELEFAGTYGTTVSTTITWTSTSTNGTDWVSTTNGTQKTEEKWNDNGMDGTVVDDRKDYDHDGLANWQEYMVGAMRCWRYDDTCAPWTSHTASAVPEYYAAFTDEDWYNWLANPEGPDYNPGFRNEHFDLGIYFSCAKNAFEQDAWYTNPKVYQHLYMFKDGVDHDLTVLDDAHKNRFGRNVSAAMHTFSTTYTFPVKYITCDPRMHDTDNDGMDDYYELFHGLNPLLGLSKGSGSGPRDVVYEAYLANNKITLPWSAESNSWLDGGQVCQQTRPEVALRLKQKTSSLYDFFQFPWLAGLAQADADGDNIRNQQEAIMANIQAAATYLHTDPSALWMTDSSYGDSLTYRYYQICNPTWANNTIFLRCSKSTFEHDGVTYKFSDYPWLVPVYEGGALVGYQVAYDAALNHWNVASGNIYEFEENEGYDSDHDFLGDFEESQGKTKNASDPQNHDDPLRRQAMWFGGDEKEEDKSFLQTPTPVYDTLPADEKAGSEVRQDFLYYTVECWAKPDVKTYNRRELQTLVERAIWTGPANAADERYLRKNFLIGIQNGRWYTRFDSTGTDTKQYVEITDGPLATTNWTHLAATYDGAALKLYVDGVCRVTKPTELQPEHGLTAIKINEASELGGITWWDRYAITFVIGASANSKNGIVFDNQWQTRNQAYQEFPGNPLGLNLKASTTMGDYANFYRGYIDEVRVWDGARSAADILSDYQNRVRYDAKLAAENRSQVYAVWAQGGRRSPDTELQLPPELRFHWAFDHLSGAIDPTDVIKEPAGFATSDRVTDAMAVWSRPVGWEDCWITSLDNSLRSKIYSNHAWVPWINDTIGHLPWIDNTTLDSFYWSVDFAGWTPAAEAGNGYTSFKFPRTCELPSRRRQVIYGTDPMSSSPYRWDLVKDDETLRDYYRFAHRNLLLEGFDLIPMGSAFPKRISSDEGGMWDNVRGTSPSASDAWAQTGKDTDNNGLPDWWEEYARANYCKNLKPREKLTWDMTVTYRNGDSMPAWQAYLRDLAAGLVKNGKYVGYPQDENGNYIYADQRDNDQDNLPDWWEELYGLDTSVDNADDDPDNDGLSNYQEYVLREVYPTKYNLKDYGVDVGKINLNPTLTYSSLEQVVPDYFLRYGDKFIGVTNSPAHFYLNEYFGEIATDHDFMEDWWENLYDITYTSAHKYDPAEDKDGDGWSTWAECRASLWGAYFTASLIDKWTGTESEQYVPCYPKPIVGVKATYYGKQDISGHQLVVRTTSGQRQRVDATFIVPPVLDGQDRYLGGFSADTVMHGHLSPGMLNVNSIVFKRARVSSDKVYTWNCNWYKTNEPTAPGWDAATWQKSSRTHTGTFEEYKYEHTIWPRVEIEGGDLVWESFLSTVPSTDLDSATLMIDGTVKFGWVDCTTGEFEMNMSKFTGEGSVDEYVFGVVYTTRLGHEWPQTVYLSDTKELDINGTEGIGDGYVREGKNTIEAFIDLGDGAGGQPNGKWDAGEPYGVVQNVDVGWHKVPVVVIEMKDTAHAVVRYDVSTGADDRSAIDGTLGSGSAKQGDDADDSATGVSKTLSIHRVAINGATNVLSSTGMLVTVPRRVIATKTLVVDSRSYLTEADVLSDAKFDLDNKWLVRDAKKLGLTRSEVMDATYELSQVLTLADGTTSNVVLKTFVNKFNAQRTKPVTVSPMAVEPVYSSSPTFAFASDDATMTAYRLQVRQTGKKELVYDSGVVQLPGRVPNTAGAAVYEVTPAIYAGAHVWSGITTNHLLFADSTDYEWRVSLFNAKYCEIEDGETGAWSAEDGEQWTKFQMDVQNRNRYPDMPTGYGCLTMAVRYYGPTNLLAAAEKDRAKIYVEVFENADFRGQPMARAEATVDELLASQKDVITTNVVVRGIAPGTRFARAFIDFNGNGKRDDWESWGYVNNVGSGMKAIYNPIAIDVTAAASDWKPISDSQYTLFVEDCDTNQNEFPDCVEASFYTGDGGLVSASDSDHDGISDEDEESYSTNKALWDTDNDGVPDGWEAIFADTDPTLSDSDEAAEDDVMAFAKVPARFVTVGGVTYALADGETLPSKEKPIENLSVYTTYKYPVWENGVLVEYRGVGTNLLLTTSEPLTSIDKDGTAVLVHAQVYEKFGFDGTTATTAEGAKNTKAFTALDKYLVVRYLTALGLANEATVNANGVKYAPETASASDWAKYTLKPYVTDYDGDGIPDGWELYVMFGPDGSASVKTLSEAKVSPWNYNDANAVSPGDAKLTGDARLTLAGEYKDAPTDPWTVDTDDDGVIDAYYHEGLWNPGGDADGDGLSNYAEYLIKRVFKFANVDWNNPKTNGSCVDYFRKYGDLYLGEIFTDHDQVNDEWEQRYADVAKGSDLYANRYVYDPTADWDNDGWSNWAESKAGTNPEVVTSPGVDGNVLPEYPIPAIAAKVVYSGKQSLAAPLVFQAWSQKTDPEMQGAPDAAWRTASDAASTNVTKYIGVNPGAVRSYHLGTGAVAPGSVRIDFRDMAFERAVLVDGVETKTYPGEAGDAQWYYFVQDRNGVLYTSSTNVAPVKVGTVDYASGLVTIDFSSAVLQGAAYGIAINGDSSTDYKSNSSGEYSNFDKLDLSRSYVKIGWTPVMVDTTGNATYYLSDCDQSGLVAYKGHLREGLNKFVVFSDTDGDGKYTPGEPFGFVRDVDVGWQGGAFEVELTETSPIFARIDLRAAAGAAASDREVWQEGNSTVTDISDGSAEHEAFCQLMGVTYKKGDEALDLSQTRLTRIRVTRVLVDGKNTLGVDRNKFNVPVKGVVLDKYLDLGTRSYIHEGDFLTDGAFDVGWAQTQDQVYDRKVYVNKDAGIPTFIDATNITYAIVIGEGDIGASNLVFRCVVNRVYDTVLARDVQSGNTIRPVIDRTQPQNYVYGARPTFRWAMQDGNGNNYNSYTAFKLQIKSGSGVVYDSGYRALPPRDATGYYSWSLDEPIGSVIPASGNYSWRVSMYNAKFRDATFWDSKSEFYKYVNGDDLSIATWSNEGVFVVDMNNQQAMNDHGYSSIAAAVKYAGPSKVLENVGGDGTEGKCIVQAFTTADFAGAPAGQSYVTSSNALANTSSIVSNAVVRGLPQRGTYYLRAFIDSNGNGAKDDFESWGAANEPVTLTENVVTIPTVGIYIEDADTDGDWIPDAYEYAVKGNLTKLGSEVIDGDKIRFVGTIDAAVGTAGVSTGLSGASLTIFQNQSFVKMVMQDLGATVSLDAIRAAVEKKVNPDTVKITAVTLAPDGSKVTLSVAAEVTDSIAGTLLGKVYDLTDLTKATANVTVCVYKKETLAAADWVKVGAFAAEVGRDAAQVEVPVTGVDMKSGFYKIEVVQ